MLVARQALPDRAQWGDYLMRHAPQDGLARRIRAVTALEQAGASLSDVVRVHYYVTDRSILETVFPIFGEQFADTRPAATAILCELLDPRMKIEIEVTAHKSRG